MSAACRNCDSAPLESVLSLGQMPLANALLTIDELDRPEARFPLELAYCERCCLVQITESVAPEALFRQYPYFSSVSDAFVEHARLLAERLIAERALGPASMVVELAATHRRSLRG